MARTQNRITHKLFAQVCRDLQDYDLTEVEGCTNPEFCDFIKEKTGVEVALSTAREIAEFIDHPLKEASKQASKEVVTGLSESTQLWHSITNRMESLGLSNSATAMAKSVMYALIEDNVISLKFFPKTADQIAFDKRMVALQECVSKVMDRPMLIKRQELLL